MGGWETVEVGVVEGEREREVWEAHSEHRFPALSSQFTLRASLSGTFLQTHTPSIAFRHLAPNSHSEHRFPAPSSQLTLRASLSGTFLPTHTPSIAFRHLPPNSHSVHRFPAPSSQLTLRASLSGTFLQTPPPSIASRHLPPTHTPSIAFRHLPPNSARFGYATEGTLFISVQLSSDAVSALRKVPVLI